MSVGFCRASTRVLKCGESRDNIEVSKISTYYQEPNDGFLFLPGAFGLLLLPIFEISFFFFIARFPDFLDLTEMPECLRLEKILLLKWLILPAGSTRENRLFRSKLVLPRSSWFCSDTLILLEFCLESEEIFGPWGRIYIIFANIERSLGLTP